MLSCAHPFAAPQTSPLLAISASYSPDLSKENYVLLVRLVSGRSSSQTGRFGTTAKVPLPDNSRTVPITTYPVKQWTRIPSLHTGVKHYIAKSEWIKGSHAIFPEK